MSFNIKRNWKVQMPEGHEKEKKSKKVEDTVLSIALIAYGVSITIINILGLCGIINDTPGYILMGGTPVILGLVWFFVLGKEDK